MGNASRTFTIPTNNRGDTVDIELEEPALTAENLRLTTWGSSFILATLLHRFSVQVDSLRPAGSGNSSISVLELGAGTGLVGLAAAAVWRTKVVLTDLAPIVPGLAVNISANKDVFSAFGGGVSCGTLDWASPETLVLHNSEAKGRQQRTLLAGMNKTTIILAADTVYSEEHPALLSNTILTWLAHCSDARAIITYPMRVAYLDEIRELWELLERGGLEAIDEGREVGGKDWDDEVLHEWSIWRWRRGDANGTSIV